MNKLSKSSMLVIFFLVSQLASAEAIKIYEETPNNRNSPGSPSAIALSRGGKLVAVGVNNSLTRKTGIYIVGTGPGNNIKKLEVEKGLVSDIDFSPNLASIAYSADSKIFLTDVTTGKIQATSQKFFRSPKIAFSPDGRRLLMSDGGRESNKNYPLCILDVPSLKLQWCADKTAGSIASSRIDRGFAGDIAWISDGSKFVSGSGMENIAIWDGSDYKLLQTIGGIPYYSSGWPVAFSNDGKSIYSLANGEVLSKWSAQTGELLLGGGKPVNGGHMGSASTIWITSDGKRLALADIGSQSPRIAIVSTDNLKIIGEVKLPVHRLQQDDWIMMNTLINPSQDSYAILFRSEHGNGGGINPSDIIVEVGKLP